MQVKRLFWYSVKKSKCSHGEGRAFQLLVVVFLFKPLSRLKPGLEEQNRSDGKILASRVPVVAWVGDHNKISEL